MFESTTTHATLLARLGDGSDRAAWAEFCARYGELIRGFAQRQGAQPADCDDIVQDVLLKLSRSMPGFRYDPAKGKFRSYLKTVVIRAMYDRSAQKAGSQPVDNLEDSTRLAVTDEQIEATWELEWRRYHLRLAMQTIAVEFNRRDCEAFQRYAVEGQDVRATAAGLSMSVDQVYQAKSLISRRLCELVARQVDEEG